MTSVGIAGGGLIGSLLAWRVARSGAKVEVFDAGQDLCCSRVAAGMLSQTAELATSSVRVSELGEISLKLWRDWLSELGCEDALSQQGSLLVANNNDRAELHRIVSLIRTKAKDPERTIRPVSKDELHDLEPDLGHLTEAYFLPHEGHINIKTVLDHLQKAVTNENSVIWHTESLVDKVLPREFLTARKKHLFDWACDCRGLGAKTQLDLRPVRGEIIHIHTPEINLSRPVRLAHRRYPVYVVPRGKNNFLVGATEVETARKDEITVRSMLELLGSAYSIHPSFSEAKIIGSQIGLRPTLPDNQPLFLAEPGYITINGLYRHGFLAGPALVENACSAMELN